MIARAIWPGVIGCGGMPGALFVIKRFLLRGVPSGVWFDEPHLHPVDHQPALVRFSARGLHVVLRTHR
jgi:hypothetical protein